MIRRTLLLALSLLMAVGSLQALIPSYYAANSRLSQGRWVKVATAAEGMYQVSYETLRAMGFEHPELVQVYGYGTPTLASVNSAFTTEVPDDVQPTATLHTADKLIFFGQGDVDVSSQKLEGGENTLTYWRSDYSTTSCYFLSDAEGRKPEVSVVSANATTRAATKSHIAVELFEEELFNPSAGGSILLGHDYKGGEKAQITFDTRNYSADGNYVGGSFIYRFGVSSTTNIKFDVSLPSAFTMGKHSFPMFSRMPSVTYDVYRYTAGYADFTANKAVPAESTITIDIPQADGLKICALDRAVLRYPRANVLDAETPWLVMNFLSTDCNKGQRIQMTSAPSDAVMWSLSNPYDIRAFKSTASTGGRTFILGEKTPRAVAFSPSATFPEPEIIGQVVNQDLHACSTPAMLIIATAEMLPAANRLADLHRQYQDMDVLVVDHQQIFNEFSSGAQDAHAYRRFAKMLYDRAPSKMKYLLFMGPAYYDNRGLTMNGIKHDWLMCYAQNQPGMAQNNLLNYATDSYFACLGNDYKHEEIHYAHPNLSVGRVPALSSAQAEGYVSKVERYLASDPSAEIYSNVLLTSGPGDAGIHSSHQLEIEKEMKALNKDFTFSHAFNQLYPYSTEKDDVVYRIITQNLRRGVGYWTYSGHGNPTEIIGWNNSSANTTDYDTPAFAVISSCDQYAFDRMNAGIIETMLFHEHGGIIGGIGADRAVYINSNQKTVLNVALEYAQAKHGDTYGDIFYRARQKFVDDYIAGNQPNSSLSLQHHRNCLAYNFAGDPAVPLPTPGKKVDVSKLGSKFKVTAYKPAEISGAIRDVHGAVDSKFNGTVTFTFFDGVHTEKLVDTQEEGSRFVAYPVEIGSDRLAEFTAEVKKGRFSAKVQLPAPSVETETYRLVASAMSEDGLTAISSYDNVVIDSKDATLAVPESKLSILSFTASPAGDGEMLIEATVAAETGISNRTSGMASQSRLYIDGTVGHELTDAFAKDSDGNYRMAYIVRGLSGGNHKADIQVIDNAGHSVHSALQFTIGTDINSYLTVAEEPARSVATLSLEGGEPMLSSAADGAVRSWLTITDPNGRTVRSYANPTFPLEWSLTDAEGTPVPDGPYTARIAGAAPTQITVLR